MTDVTPQDDQKVIAEYEKHDSDYRRHKKAGQFTKASAAKAKRDALETQVNAAIKRQSGKGTGK